MNIQIRLAQSGHSHQYKNVSNVECLMIQIYKDFKIEPINQRILDKSGDLLKKQFNHQFSKDQMKKTLSTSNNNPLDTSVKNKQVSDVQINQLPCLYVYNEKQLLRPNQNQKLNQLKDRQYFLKLLKQKSQQMIKLRENTYQSNEFKEKISKKNLQTVIQNICRKNKTLLQNTSIQQKYQSFLEKTSKFKQLNFQICQLTNLCQSQCKAGKTIIRSINFVNHQKCKKKLLNLFKKVQTLKNFSLPEDQVNFKQNSIYFNNSKKDSTQTLDVIIKKKQELDQKLIIGEQRYKKAKKEWIAQKQRFEEKRFFQISRLNQKLKSSIQQSTKSIKQLYSELIEQLQKISKKEKQQKQSIKLSQLFQKISLEEDKIKKIIQQQTQFYVQLSEIHQYNEKVQIKEVYKTYVNMRKYFDQLDSDIKKLQREAYRYQKQFQQKVKSKKEEIEDVIIKKQEQKSKQKSVQKKESSPTKDNTLIEKQKQCNLPKSVSICSPGKKKIAKNTIKYFNEQSHQDSNSNRDFIELQEITRRLNYNRRIKNILHFCQNLQKQEERKRKKYNNCNSKSYQCENKKIDSLQSLQILKVITAPMIFIDYENTSDQNLENLKDILVSKNDKLQQKSSNISIELTWQQEIIQAIKFVNLQMNIFMASPKYEKSSKEKDLQKLLELSTDLLTKLYKKKTQIQKQKIKMKLSNQYEDKLLKLKEQNKNLNSYINSLKESIQNGEIEDDAPLIQNKNDIKELGSQSIQFISNSQRFLKIQKNAKFLSQINEKLERQNKILSYTNQNLQKENKQLKAENTQLNQKLFNYKQEIDQITSQLPMLQQASQQVQQLREQIQQEKVEKANLQNQLQKINHLIQTQKTAHLQEIQQVKHHLNMQKENSFNLKKQIKDLTLKLKQMKKNIDSYQSSIETLQNGFIQERNAKQALQEEFQRLKIFLADREVHIIRLQEIIEKKQKEIFSNSAKYERKQSQNQQFFENSNIQTINKIQLQNSFYGQKRLSSLNNQNQQCSQKCNCSQAIQNLKSQNQDLRFEIEGLQKQLREILIKQTIDVQMQTQKESTQQIQMQIKYQSHYYQNYESQHEQKWKIKNIHKIQNQHQDRIQSQYSYQKMISSNHENISNYNKLTISKSIAQGNLHLFLPFANDVYIGVTIQENQNNITNYQEYLNRATIQHFPFYQLNLNSMNKKIKQLLRQFLINLSQSSLVLAVRVNKLQVVEQNQQQQKLILVNGKIEFALGFQDEDMSIKNYAPFLYE